MTLQPLARFPLDAAILFSDILTVPHAMGLGLYFETGEGPRIRAAGAQCARRRTLPVPDPEDELRYVIDAVRLIRRELAGRVPLIGFAGSAVDRRHLHGRGWLEQEFRPYQAACSTTIRPRCTRCSTSSPGDRLYLNAQIAAGAQAVMVFDTWGGVLAPAAYREFSLRYMKRIVAKLVREREGARVPVILFTKGGGAWLDRMVDSGCDALGVDWTTDLATARRLAAEAGRIAGQPRPGRALRIARGDPRGGPARCSRAMAAARATCSTSVTASIRTSTRNIAAYWSPRSMSCRPRCSTEFRPPLPQAWFQSLVMSCCGIRRTPFDSPGTGR